MSRNVLGDASSRSTWGREKQRKYWVAPVVFAGAVAVVIIAVLPFWALSDKPLTAKPTEDLPAGAMQAKATTACLECHEARIILQQRLSKGAWTKEVDKMVKWGAVVDANDHDALIDYLSMNFSPAQPAYEPPLTAADKNTSRESPRKPAK